MTIKRKLMYKISLRDYESAERLCRLLEKLRDGEIQIDGSLIRQVDTVDVYIKEINKK